MSAKQGKPKVRCFKKEAKPEQRIDEVRPLRERRTSFRFDSARATSCWDTTQQLREGETSQAELNQDIVAHTVLMAEFIANGNEAAAEEIRGVIAGIVRAVAWYYGVNVREAGMMLPSVRPMVMEAYQLEVA
jgi:hypothetical protein